jgi:hypothetical protein
MCDSNISLQHQDTFTKKLACFSGYADVGIFIYIDDEKNMGKPQGCHLLDDSGENVAYYFEVSCQSLCLDRGATSDALSPSSTPHPSFPVETNEPFDCEEQKDIASDDIIMQAGSNIDIPTGSVKILEANNKTATIGM